MPDEPISALPATTTVIGTDLGVAVHAGVTNKITITNLMASLLAIGGNGSNLTSLAASQLVGNLLITSFNGGVAAGPTTFWRGDGTWATFPGGEINPLVCRLSNVDVTGAGGATVAPTDVTNVLTGVGGGPFNTSITAGSAMGRIIWILNRTSDASVTTVVSADGATVENSALPAGTSGQWQFDSGANTWWRIL